MIMALIVVLGILVYTWVGYPVLIMLVGWKAGRTSAGLLKEGERERRKRPEEFPSPEGLGVGSSPLVIILFSAHNEETVIRERLENLARLDYPEDKLQILVGVDGGADRTGEIALEWGASRSRVRVLVEPVNRGKMAMLKRLVGGIDLSPSPEREGPAAAGAVLVFTDANTMFRSDALRRLVALFSDPKVGGVCGRLVFTRAEAGSRSHGSEGGQRSPVPGGTDEPAYWNLETRMKTGESTLDSCLGANGAIYAIRAELFPAEIPDNTIIDDFVIGMKVREQGYRMVYEPGAVATEELPATIQHEWRRRVRIGAGAYQAMTLCRVCLSPRYGVFAWMFWSHKVLRWFTPHLLLIFLGLGIGILAGGVPKPVLLALCCCFGMVVLGWAFRPCRKGLGLLVYFMAMQAALLAGFFRFCKGNLTGTWERTERGRKSEEPTPGPSREGSGREIQDRRSSPPRRG